MTQIKKLLKATNIMLAYYKKWNQIPEPVRVFFYKALALLVIWKILYLIFLLPARVIDEPLTYSTGVGSTSALNWLSDSQAFSSKKITVPINLESGAEVLYMQTIYLHNRLLVGIADACNGLELFVLYAGFIVCLPATAKRKLLFVLGGLITIYLINIVRCTALAVIILKFPQHADFAHHYVFTFLVYAFVIYLWLIFSKKLSFHVQTK